MGDHKSGQGSLRTRPGHDGCQVDADLQSIPECASASQHRKGAIAAALTVFTDYEGDFGSDFAFDNLPEVFQRT